MFPPEPPELPSSYRPEEEDQLTQILRDLARQEAFVDAFLASIDADDGRRDLIAYRLQREFLTRRRMRPFRD
jgi:hypothetical protein